MQGHESGCSSFHLHTGARRLLSLQICIHHMRKIAAFLQNCDTFNCALMRGMNNTTDKKTATINVALVVNVCPENTGDRRHFLVNMRQRGKGDSGQHLRYAL